jgi:hypothetical protein
VRKPGIVEHLPCPGCLARDGNEKWTAISPRPRSPVLIDARTGGVETPLASRPQQLEPTRLKIVDSRRLGLQPATSRIPCVGSRALAEKQSYATK